MGKLTIYVSEKLHKKLKENKINRSAVCQEAFEKKLYVKNKIITKEKILKKLKLKILQQQEGYDDDFEYGIFCAKDLAEADKLNYEDFVLAYQNKIGEDAEVILDSKIEEIQDNGNIADKRTIKEGYVCAVNEIREKMGISINNEVNQK